MNFRDGVLHIGRASTSELVRRFGSPLYVYDASVVRRQVTRLLAAFRDFPLVPLFAMKANSSLALLRLMRESGLGCDAVSPGEVFLAKKAGFAGDRIWFTCANISDEDLEALRDRDVIINVNSMSELDRCVRLRLPNSISLRVNPEVGAGHHRDVITGGFGVKFGFDPAELPEAKGIAEVAGLEIVGIHAHIGSGVEEVAPLLRSAGRLLSLISEFENLRWLNFGGGLSVPYKPGETEFPVEEYGTQLATLAADTVRERSIQTIIEPGRYLVAQSGVLLTTVTSMRISAGSEWIGCDTGFNHLVRPSKYGAYHHIVNATRGEDEHLRENWPNGDTSLMSEVIVAGNLCESGDVFTRDLIGIAPRKLPPTRFGDLLAICDVGAYGFSMASHYNARLLPAEVLVEDNKVTLIRERQKYSDLLRGQ